LSLTTTKLVVFTLSAAIAGLAGALFGAAESVAGTGDFVMFRSLLVLAVVAIGGVSLCSSALVGGMVLGFLPNNPQFLYIGAGTFLLAGYPEGLFPGIFLFFRRQRQNLFAGADRSDETEAEPHRAFASSSAA
jgi:ABC-type branched-subunit amino acid transport system permease subunit